METKSFCRIFLIAALFCAAVSVSAQTQKLTRSAYQKQMKQLLSQKPGLPSFKPSDVESKLKAMRETFIDFEFPADCKQLKGKKMPTPVLLRMIARNYKKVVDDPELEEATGNRKEWYEDIGAAFVALNPPLTVIQKAYTQQDPTYYRAAVMEYRKRGEQLKQLLASPVMVPAGELERIKEQNTRRRKAVLQKKIRDLQKQGYRQ